MEVKILVKYVEGNIFETHAKVLVNTVNTVGVMGKGIALKFKKLYPEMFKKYQEFCEKQELSIGKLFLYKTPNKWILNFPTKTTWKEKSKLEYIEAGLKKFVDTYQEKGITSIAFPKLGCGNGGLNWEYEVKPLMKKYLDDLNIDIFIYVKIHEDMELEHQNIEKTRSWLRQTPRDLSYTEVLDDLRQLFDNKNEFIDGNLYHIKWSDDYLSINDSNMFSIEDFIQLWHVIRKVGIISKEDFLIDVEPIPKKVLFHMFTKLDYMKPIIVYDNTPKAIKMESLQYYPPASELNTFVTLNLQR